MATTNETKKHAKCYRVREIIERFFKEFRKTKTTSNQSDQSQSKTIKRTNQNSKQLHVAGTKREKTNVSVSWLVLVLLLISQESGGSF